MRSAFCLTLAGAFVLAACASPAERAARMQAEIDEMVQVYGPACDKLGYKRGDDKWRDCVIHLSWKDELRYSPYPSSTTCFGSAGFFNCTSF